MIAPKRANSARKHCDMCAQHHPTFTCGKTEISGSLCNAVPGVSASPRAMWFLFLKRDHTRFTHGSDTSTVFSSFTHRDQTYRPCFLHLHTRIRHIDRVFFIYTHGSDISTVFSSFTHTDQTYRPCFLHLHTRIR